MPGIHGRKLFDRKSKSGKFRSIKMLVFSLLDKNAKMEREAVEKIVMHEYPKSNFVHKKGSHFPWYLHKWKRGQLENEFILREQLSKDIKTNGVAYEKTRLNVSKKGNVRRATRVGSKKMGELFRRTEN